MGGTSLQAVATLLVGAVKLQRAITVAAREADRTGHSVLQPVVAAFKVGSGVRGPGLGQGCSGCVAVAGAAAA